MRHKNKRDLKNNAMPKKFTTKMQRSLLLLFCGIVVLMSVLIFMITKINNDKGETYSKRVLNQQSYISSSISYRRGDILDRNGTVLATSVKVYNLILDVKLLTENEKYIDSTLAAISEYFDLELTDLETTMEEKSSSSYVVLAKEIDADTKEAFDEFADVSENNVKGVWFEEEYKRTYPLSTLASSLIGFTVSGDVGTYGIEQYYNDDLVGTNGVEYGYFDSELNLVRNVKDAENGNTIVTTIDANVQRIVEEKIQEFIEEHPAKNIGVVVMNPNNGEIYAMSSDVQYDLNNPRDLTSYYSDSEIEAMSDDEQMTALYAIWRNHCISDSYEPGSTFKPFTIAAALEENVIKTNSTYYCAGYENIYGTTIKCNKHSGHGRITLTEAIMYSCNSALMQIGEKLGANLFWTYENNFLFGQKTNIDLPGEAVGILPDESFYGPTELATSSFGQTTEVTMIQLAAGFCSLVNGGYYYQPHVMKEIQSESGTTIESNDGVLVKQTVSQDTSDFLKQALYQTVESGTAQGAQVEGYLIGGKTGTAQKLPRDAGTYILSFIGAVPIDDPEVVIYVTLDELEDETIKSDSSMATTFASSILEEILPCLGIYPESGDIDYSVYGVDTEVTEDTDTTDDTSEDSEEVEVENDPLTDEYDGEAIDDSEVDESEFSALVEKYSASEEPETGTEMDDAE